MPNRKTPTASNYQSGALAALTVRTIFTPASNTTGIKIHSGSYYGVESTNGIGHFVIATSAPSSMNDGATISEIISIGVTANAYPSYKIKDDSFVPAGYGLYWISAAVASGASTDVSWSLA